MDNQVTAEKLIQMRTLYIGDFSDGSLRFDKKRVKATHAAVVQFKSAADAQKFAQTVRLGAYADFVITAPEGSEPKE